MKKFSLAIILISLALPAFAKTKLVGVDFVSSRGSSQLLINFSEPLSGMPVLEVKNSLIQLAFPDIEIWPKVEKQVGDRKELSVNAYQFDSETGRVRLIFPKSIAKYKDRISVTVKKNQVKLNFPYSSAIPAVKSPVAKFNARKAYVTPKNPIVRSKAANQKVKLSLDESYLASLMKKDEKKPKPLNNLDTITEDNKKESKPSFNFNTYIVKFIFFLTLIIGGFLLIVKLFKKGAFSKSKLGLFSSDSELIKVINTTYIAPKKSLLLVKVHHQLLLLSNSEAGITFLSEVEDQVGALKKGESEVVGSNFDELVSNSETEKSKINEKEDIYKSKNKFSDEIKRKLKTLKPLQ